MPNSLESKKMEKEIHALIEERFTGISINARVIEAEESVRFSELSMNSDSMDQSSAVKSEHVTNRGNGTVPTTGIENLLA